MKNVRLFVFLLLSVCSATHVYAQATVTLKSLLTDMTNAASVASWPQPTFTLKQVSSYDRKSTSADKPGWFANGDFNHFIREEKKNGRSEFVMMDADGPGVIVRFWLTSLIKTGRMRFYLDNEEKPSIEMNGFDLMKGGLSVDSALLNPHSSYEADGKGGNTLYLPIPYQKHCKVTWEYTDTALKNKPHYYQINYRTYPSTVKVKTFTMKDLKTEAALLKKTDAILWNPPLFRDGEITKINQPLAAHKTASTELPEGSAAIQLLTLKLNTPDNNNYEKAWRFVYIKIEFDGQETVWCPLGDFAGSGYGSKVIKSWYRALDSSGTLTSRWVMPYQKNAKVSIVNKADFDVVVSMEVSTAKWKWDNNSMYFHASYKFGKNVKDVKWDYDLTKVAKDDPNGPIDFNFNTIKGRGVYVGNTIAVDNHMNTWYGEGDAKAYVDGERFPSEFGTGLEDYYNTSWAPVVLYQTPFANAPRADNISSFGHNTFTRTRNLDGIPFNSSFSFDMEMLSWDGGYIDCTATTYWYGFAGAMDDSERE
jgi:hypothetical protein